MEVVVAETQKEEQVEQEEIRHFHVLAVDDSKLDRKILEQLLTVSSYQGIFFFFQDSVCVKGNYFYHTWVFPEHPPLGLFIG